MTYEILRDTISAGGIDAALRTGLAVPEERIPAERERYAAALAAFGELYGTEASIPSAVGARSPATTPTTTTAGSSPPASIWTFWLLRVPPTTVWCP